MRLIICGGRDFQDHELFHTAVTDWIAAHGRSTEIVTGGADAMAWTWAGESGIKRPVFQARWDDLAHPQARLTYRRDGTPYNAAAGPIHNWEMAAYAGLFGQGGCLALRGTPDMVRRMSSPWNGSRRQLPMSTTTTRAGE